MSLQQPPTETVLEPGVTDAVRSSSNDVEPGIEEERVEERHPRPVSIPINGRDQTSISEHAELARRFEALASEREELRNEVEKLRISLEAVTEQHRTEVSTLQSSLTAAQQDKDASDSNYRSLVGKVNTIRASLGERLKADAVSDFPSIC